MKSLLARELEWMRAARLHDAITSLLLPGLRGLMGKAMQQCAPRGDWRLIQDRLEAHLQQWLPQHMEDYKTRFSPDMTEWLRRETLDPECYPPLVVECASPETAIRSAA